MTTFVSQPYTTTNVTINQTYGPNGSASFSGFGTGEWTTTSNNAIWTSAVGFSGQAASAVLNQGIYLSNTGTADLLGGDSTVTFTLYYAIATFPT